MKYTNNYNLKKPEPTKDYYNIEHENTNMDILDQQIKKNADGIASHTNMQGGGYLINGNFDLWQNGTEYSILSSMKTADRWFAERVSTVNSGCTVKRSSDVPNTDSKFSLMNTGTVAGGVARVTQEISSSLNLSKKPITISFYVKLIGTAKAPSIVINGQGYEVVADNYWKKITITKDDLISGINTIGFQCTVDKEGDGFLVSQFKVEVGELATPFIPKAYSEEYASSRDYNINQYGVVRGGGYLVNGNFDLWSQGERFDSPTNEITSDSWYATGGNGKAEISRSKVSEISGANYSLTFKQKEGAAGGISPKLYQKIKFSSGLLKKSDIAVSFWAKSSDYNSEILLVFGDKSNIVTKPIEIITDGQWHKYDVTIETPDFNDDEALEMRFQMNNTKNFSVEFAQIKVELGNMTTPYIPRPYSEEYAASRDYNINPHGVMQGGGYLVNGDFQLWTNGEFFKADENNIETADGWRIDRDASGSNLQIVRTVDGNLNTKVLSVGSIASRYINIQQEIKDYQKFSNKTVTLSMRVKGTAGKRIQMYLGDGANSGGETWFVTNGTWQDIVLVYTVRSDPSWLRIGVQPYQEVGFDLEIETAKLELGDRATPYVPKLRSEEYAASREYNINPYGVMRGGGHLINGDFQIWQRGTEFINVSNYQYTADRICVASFTSDDNRIRKVPGIINGFKNALRIEAYGNVPPAGSVTEVVEKVEDYEIFRGKEVTFSIQALVDTGASIELQLYDGKSSYYSGVVSGDGTIKNLELTKTISPEATALWAIIKFVKGGTPVGKGLTIQTRKLELGDRATPYIPKTFAEELGGCQRYYSKSYNQSDAPGGVQNEGSFSAYARKNNILFETIHFKNSMRAKPTVTAYDMTGAKGKVSAWTAEKKYISIPIFGVDMNGENSFRLIALNGDVSNPTNYDFHWTADAEIY